MNIRIISAGAGSGKTYRLTSEMVKLLKSGVRPTGIIATTFTKKAAAELKERVRVRLLEQQLFEQADQIMNALIGTVHSLGVKLLQRFAYEAGVSPNVSIMDDADHQTFFNQCLAVVLSKERVEKVEKLCDQLGLNKRGHYDWRKEVKQISDVARVNDFSFKTLELSKKKSFDSFLEFLDPKENVEIKQTYDQLSDLFSHTIENLIKSEDKTKKTQSYISYLKELQQELKIRGTLFWYHWIKLIKQESSAKTKELTAELKTFAQTHLSHPEFHHDIQTFIEEMFDIAMASIKEYEQFKKSRGLIDYIDMEVHINHLLDNPKVKHILNQELDLLMVDEFQDTSPIQLEIFVKLSQIASNSVWVGDPKQSIYGFRGAEPQLMKHIIDYLGGIKPEDIQPHSWRSREDIVYATNALFTKAFKSIPADQVALQPKRTKIKSDESLNDENEPLEVGDALIHWHIKYNGEGKRMPKKPWFERCIAQQVRSFLENPPLVLPKGSNHYRGAQPGDIAILCRSNRACQEMAESLTKSGFKVAIARSGLLQTTEAKIILACLRFLMNKYDTLAVAEILLLRGDQDLQAIVEDRIKYLDLLKVNGYSGYWGKEVSIIQQLEGLSKTCNDLTSSETLNLLLEELNIRDLVASWGNSSVRLDNIESFRKLAIEYEGSCNRLNLAASLAGFLLWLNDLEKQENDKQAFGQSMDTVNVLTYHKSKGLEWPIVIMHDLETPLKPKIWGVNLMNESQDFDVNHILANRWIRYWINPYGDQIRNTTLQERIEQSHFHREASHLSLMEDARLLYVGMTRARDYLIFPTRDLPTKWLNRIWQDGVEDIPTLDADTYESCWSWDGYWLPKETEICSFGKEIEQFNVQEENALAYPPPKGQVLHLTATIDLRREILFENLSIKMASPIKYYKDWDIPLGVEPYFLGKLVKAFLHADHSNYSASERTEIAENLIRQFEVGPFINAQQLVQQSDRWHQALSKTFAFDTLIKKYPLDTVYDERYFTTIVDLVLQTDQETVLIQNSGYRHPNHNWNKKIKELGPWLHLSKLTVKGSGTSGRNIRTFVHFVMAGQLVEVNTDVPKKD